MPKRVSHEERREAFAEAAYRVIEKRGLAGTTMQEVAKEAGFTTGGLVHYLSSKDELLLAAAEVAAKTTRTLIGESVDRLSGLEALRTIMHLSLPISEERRGAWNVRLGYWERSSQNAAVRSLMQDRYLEFNARLVKLITSAQKTGELPADVDAARAAHSAIALLDGIGVQVLLAGHEISPALQKGLVEDWLIGTFRLNRETPPKTKGHFAPAKRRSAGAVSSEKANGAAGRGA